MNAPSATTSSPAAPVTGCPAARIDATAELPLFALFAGAACWLFLATLFGLIGSLKFHNAGFLANISALTYGRVYPAWSNLLVYGFCIPTGLGVSLWLLARLGRTPIAWPWLVAIAAQLWHLGIFFGVVGLLHGSTTGFEWLELPRYAADILFISFLLIALAGFRTYRNRVDGELYPSQWFALASLFWFPWIYSTAILLLERYHVRGVVQASVAWWFAGNLLVVWIGLTGLAAGLYFLPKLTGQPLQSRYLALFAFLTLVFFGTWTGIPHSAALPVWMPMFSGGATLLLLVPAFTVATIIRKTGCGRVKPSMGGPLCFTKFGLWAMVLSSIALALTGCRHFGQITTFTWYTTGQVYLNLYGFFAMIMFGAVYYILPRVAGIEFPLAKLVKLHFLCGAAGVVLLAFPLLLGGICQGMKLVDPTIPFLDITRSSLMFLRVATFGELLIALGALMFLLNVSTLIAAYFRAMAVRAVADATATVPPMGVKA